MIWGPSFGGLWRDRRFLTFWSAQSVSEFGDRITELALPLIAVTMLNATPAEVGLLTAAVWLPNLLSLVIGSWVEQRPDKRPLMVAADLFRLVVLLSLPAAFWLMTGAFLSINNGIRPFGAVLGGILGSLIGPRDTLLISAVGGVFAVLWLLRSPVLKVTTIDALQRQQAELSPAP